MLFEIFVNITYIYIIVFHCLNQINSYFSQTTNGRGKQFTPPHHQYLHWLASPSSSMSKTRAWGCPAHRTTSGSNLVGSNTNIQIGDFAHVYYSTLYTSKTTQKDDTASFLAVSNALDRRITKAMNEGTASDEPDFVEGLSRVLSGIRAHLSSNVMSATMGHLLVTQGSRFSFSHSFSNLLLTQLQDLINEKEV